MLGALRKNSKNTIIYVLFGIIIAVFIINFGPGSRGCEGPDAHSYAARVMGTSISENEFRYAYVAKGFTQYPLQVARENHLKEALMDMLIERELLAQEAESWGFEVPEREVEDMITEGRFYVLGKPVKTDDFEKDGVYDYERFRGFCQNRLGVTPKRFIEIQQRELMANEVRQLLLGATKLPPDEVRADYEQRGLQVNLEFVRFPTRRYEEQATPTAADVQAYRKSHEAELKKNYDERPYLYKKVDRQARLRRILVALAKDASEADVAKARAKIDQAAKRIRGGQPFADVARAVSEDPRSRARGGDSGWRKKGFTGLPPALDDRLFGGKTGDLIGPERTERGFELVTAEVFREGDLSFESVVGEIAETEIVAEKAKAAARLEAEGVVARLKAGAKLEALFPKASEETLGVGEAGPERGETGLFSRRADMIPKVGISPPLARRAFALKPGEVDGPFDAMGGPVVVVAKERKEPDWEYFGQHQDDEVRKAEREKWAEVLGAWTRQRCLAVRDEGRIKVNQDILSYEGIARETTYEPCRPAGRF